MVQIYFFLKKVYFFLLKQVFFISKTKKNTPSFYQTYNQNVSQNISRDEVIDLKDFSKKDQINEISDQGNCVVNVENFDYMKKMENVLYS